MRPRPGYAGVCHTQAHSKRCPSDCRSQGISISNHCENPAQRLRVFVVEYDSPGLVAYYSVVRTGSRNEVEPGKSGFAHFFEHMMFRERPISRPKNTTQPSKPWRGLERLHLR